MKGFMSGLFGSLGAISIVFFVLGAALAYARLVPPLPGFGLWGIGMALGVVSTIAGVVLLIRNGMQPSVGLALLGLPPAAFLMYSIVAARGYPSINDISTELLYPPLFVHALTLPENEGRDMGLPESFKTQITSGYPDLSPLAFQEPVDAVFSRALDLAREHKGWEVTSTRISEKESIFEGHATSRVFGFVDDFVVRVTKADGGCVVDMRSKSRDGKGDLGANAKRIQLFFEELQPPSPRG